MHKILFSILIIAFSIQAKAQPRLELDGTGVSNDLLRLTGDSSYISLCTGHCIGADWHGFLQSEKVGSKYHTSLGTSIFNLDGEVRLYTVGYPKDGHQA